jgi:hypothetical protein
VHHLKLVSQWCFNKIDELTFFSYKTHLNQIDPANRLRLDFVFKKKSMRLFPTGVIRRGLIVTTIKVFLGCLITAPVMFLAASADGRAEIFTVNQTITLNASGIGSAGGAEYYTAQFSDVSPVTVKAGDEITGTISFINGPILLASPSGAFTESVIIYFSPSPVGASLGDTSTLDFLGLAGTFPETNPFPESSGGCCFTALQFQNASAFDFSFTGLTYTINITSVSTGSASVYLSQFSLDGQTVEFGTAIPEPSSAALCGIGCVALAWAVRRRHANHPKFPGHGKKS